MQITVPTRNNTSQHSEGPLQRFVIHLPTKRDRHVYKFANKRLPRQVCSCHGDGKRDQSFLGMRILHRGWPFDKLLLHLVSVSVPCTCLLMSFGGSVRIRKMINYNRLYATELKFSRLGLITTYSHAVCRCIGVSIRGLREFGEPTCWVEMMHHSLSSPDLPAGSCLIRRFLRGISHLDLWQVAQSEFLVFVVLSSEVYSDVVAGPCVELWSAYATCRLLIGAYYTFTNTHTHRESRRYIL